MKANYRNSIHPDHLVVSLHFVFVLSPNTIQYPVSRYGLGVVNFLIGDVARSCELDVAFDLLYHRARFLASCLARMPPDVVRSPIEEVQHGVFPLERFLGTTCVS